MLTDQIAMRPFARSKWNRLSEDAKVTLDAALSHAAKRPAFVTQYQCYYRQVSGHVLEFNHFKIGDATFVIALVDNIPPEILWDFSLDDGLPMYDSMIT